MDTQKYEKIDIDAIIETWVPRIRKLRIRQGVLADAAGVHAAQLSQYIWGRLKPRMASFERIENKLREFEADRR